MANGGGHCASCGKDWPEGTRCPDDGTALITLKPIEDPLIGLELDGRYTVRARLGRGGMGAVYRAWQHSVGREVAVKVMTLGEGDQTASKRFMREANLLGQLRHPGIVSVLDFGQLPDGRLYLAMELIEGDTLHSLVRAEGAVSVERAVGIGAQMCDVLEVAHHQGIIHRDLKPANVMVTRTPSGRDVVKVLDFGLARSLTDSERFTSSGLIVGSAQFLAPEVVGGEDATPVSDLYALGGILFWLLTGQYPFGNKHGFTEIFGLQVQNKLEPFPPSVPPALRRLVRLLLDAAPERRPVSAAVVREMLGGVATSPAPADPVEKPRSRRSTTALVVTGASLLGAALAAVLLTRGAGATTAPLTTRPGVTADAGASFAAGVTRPEQPVPDASAPLGAVGAVQPEPDAGALLAEVGTSTADDQRDAGRAGGAVTGVMTESGRVKRRDAGVAKSGKRTRRDAGHPSDEMPGDWVQ